ncbi:CopG family transcriptional regulator [Streptomyces marincola]|uniref:CopG family transcriptional regulator n=1 Tax=Streptomyces marincola TaxID=2878388 RepID=A0A1W7D6G8_9ACTN|nr:CopG family transcriptional regulator [Streptomyces marincola]ARQ72557.1 CopG family transcriptional regulator [Streptomyces marincola]
MTEPTGTYSTTMPRGGPAGPSAHVAAVARQIERDRLDELIQVAEAEHGPIAEEEVQALRDRLGRARGDAEERTGI